MYFGFHVGKQKLYSFLDRYLSKHPEDPCGRVLQQLPDTNRPFLTTTMLQHRLRLPDLGVYGVVINNTVSDMLGFEQRFSINMDVWDEIARELGCVNQMLLGMYHPWMRKSGTN